MAVPLESVCLSEAMLVMMEENAAYRQWKMLGRKSFADNRFTQ